MTWIDNNFSLTSDPLFPNQIAASNQEDTLISQEKLLSISAKISATALTLLDQYRSQHGLPPCSLEINLQKGAAIRSAEILDYYHHLRPDGSDGCELPFELGYDSKSTVTREVMGKLYVDSVKWLQINGPQKILEDFQDSIADFLQGDTSDEHALGVYIREEATHYQMGFVYLCGKKAVPDSAAAYSLNRKHLIQVYNESNSYPLEDLAPALWSQLILAKAEVKRVYRDPRSTAEELESATSALLAVMKKID